MRKAFLIFWLCCVSSMALELTTDCPPYFLFQDGNCQYSISYMNESNLHGLRKRLTAPTQSLSPKQIDLGRYLFFDPLLSREGSVSCAHCHQPQFGLSDGRAKSIGIEGHEVDRSAPSLWNVAFSPTLFWDGRASSLEKQAEGPLFHPHEMGNSKTALLKSLRENPTYVSMFQEAFGKGGVNLDRVTLALSSFQRTLLSFNSRYDRYVFGDQSALNKTEVRGLTLFRSFVTRCTECHTPPLFTNFQAAVIGAPDQGTQITDLGMGKILKNEKMYGAFRVPTLRNISKTAPFMHSGIFPTLLDVVQFYNQGGGRSLQKNPYLHWHIRSMGLRHREVLELVAFLKTLEDESALPEIPKSIPSGLPVLGGL